MYVCVCRCYVVRLHIRLIRVILYTGLASSYIYFNFPTSIVNLVCIFQTTVDLCTLICPNYMNVDDFWLKYVDRYATFIIEVKLKTTVNSDMLIDEW